MSTFELRIGDWITYDYERHEVCHFVDTSVVLRSETGHVQALPIATVQRACSRTSPAAGRTQVYLLDREAALETLDADERARIKTLEAHLLEVETGFTSGDPSRPGPGEPRPEYAPSRSKHDRVQAKADELGRSKAWTFHRLRKLRQEGIIGLADGRKLRSSDPLGSADPDLIAAIRDQYDAEEEDSAATIGGRFRRRVANRLASDPRTANVVMPPMSTWYRYVEAALPGSPDGPTTTRRTKASQPDRTFGTVQARRPGEIVMIDTTRLDVIAYDAVTDTNIGCELTVALDLATRSILAWRLTPRSTKAIDLGLLLADMMTPEPMRAHWPDSLRWSMTHLPVGRLMSLDERVGAAAMRPVIYPEVILVDHGGNYQSDLMRRACRALHIETYDARLYKATDKPHIERLFRTIRTQFSEHVAGYKGHDIAHRGRRSSAEARWSIPELEEFFAEYVVAIYQRRPHDGLHAPGQPQTRLSPNEAYGLAVAALGYVICPEEPDLYFELLPIHWRQIHPRGVEVNRLVYDGELLYRYRDLPSPYGGRHQGKWPVRIDPRDCRHAYLRDPANGTWHTLRWIHADAELRPFSDATLRECKRILALRNLDTGDQDAVAEALRDLQNRMDAPESWGTHNRRLRARDSQHARAAARDRNRGRSEDSPRLASDDEPADTWPAEFEAEFDLSDLGSFGNIEFGPIPGED